MLACLLIFLGVNSGVEENREVNNSTARELSDLKTEKVVYLTFDDGPSRYTSKVLDTLKTYDAKATFFLIGDSITEEYEDLIFRMEEEGHAIGLHCSCHNYNKIYESTESCTESILAEREFLRASYGIETDLCRLPGGSTNIYINNREQVIEVLHNEGLRIFDWNVSAEDSVGIPSEESIMENIFPEIYDFQAPVVLLHDGICNELTANLLPEIMKELDENGYVFKSLAEREEFFYK